jgi:REP element-mobilizing transposase RayT
MRDGQPPVYIHVAWATWERLPLLTETIERAVHRAIAAEFAKHKADAVAVGGVADHVHLLARISTSVSIADLLKYAKGSTAHLITHQLTPDEFFRWQPGYGVVSVSPRHLPQVADYIARQKEHHAAGSLLAALEDIGRHSKDN